MTYFRQRLYSSFCPFSLYIQNFNLWHIFGIIFSSRMLQSDWKYVKWYELHNFQFYLILAVRGLNQYNTKSLNIHKSLTNCLIIKNYTIFWKQILWIFHMYYQKKVFFSISDRKCALNAKNVENNLSITFWRPLWQLNFWPS